MPDRLPVTWIDYAGKKRLIRGTPTGLLAGVVRNLARRGKTLRGFLMDNSPQTVTALCRELRTRRPDVPAQFLHYAALLDAPSCACGGPGLYIVNTTTYCRRCRPQAVARKTAYRVHVEQRSAEFTKALQESSKGKRRRELHHKVVQHRKGYR